MAGGRRTGVVGFSRGERGCGPTGHGDDSLAHVSHSGRDDGPTGYRDLRPLAARNEPLRVGKRRRRWVRGEHGRRDRVQWG